jgi:hypothetical protein
VTSVADDEGLITDEDQNQVENAAKLLKIVQNAPDRARP